MPPNTKPKQQKQTPNLTKARKLHKGHPKVSQGAEQVQPGELCRGVWTGVGSVGFPRRHVRVCSEAAAPGGAWAAEPALGAGTGRGRALGAGSWPSVPSSRARPEPDGGRVPRHGAAGGSEFAGHRAGAAG